MSTPKKRWLRPGVLIPLALLAVLFAGAALAPAVAPDDPLEQNAGNRLQQPSARHPFGTDGFGRDVFSRTLFGARTTFVVALASVAVATLAGAVWGASSALVGGKADLLSQRLADLVLGFPSVVLAIVIVVAMKPSPLAIGVAIAAGLTPRIARIARASALVVSAREFVIAARSLGLGTLKIVFKHILPGIRGPVLTHASAAFGIAIVTEATMSFLGLGVPPPSPSLGRMLQEGARQYFETAPWVTLFPGLVIATAVVSLAILSDTLSERISLY